MKEIKTKIIIRGRIEKLLKNKGYDTPDKIEKFIYKCLDKDLKT